MPRMELHPCGSCARHVRADDRCPFCGGTPKPPRRAPTLVRATTRAAVFYLGASLAGCSEDPQPVPVYGGPPVPVEQAQSEEHTEQGSDEGPVVPEPAPVPPEPVVAQPEQPAPPPQPNPPPRDPA